MVLGVVGAGLASLILLAVVTGLILYTQWHPTTPTRTPPASPTQTLRSSQTNVQQQNRVGVVGVVPNKTHTPKPSVHTDPPCKLLLCY